MKTSSSFFVLALACGCAHAQILVGLNGTAGTITFNSSPTLPATEWASSVAGVGVGSGAYVSAADVAAAVQTVNQNSITNALERITADSLSEDARHNTTAGYLITQSSGVGATLLKATLRNNSGMVLSQITVGYNFGIVVAPGVETAPGHRVFFSTSGQTNSWQPIPQFSGLTSAAPVSAALSLGSWLPNTDIYLLWADDNTDENPDGGYTIDNFSVSNVVVAPPPGNDMCSGTVFLQDRVSYSMNTANATSTNDFFTTACGVSVGKGVWFGLTVYPYQAGLLTLNTTADFPVAIQSFRVDFPQAGSCQFQFLTPVGCTNYNVGASDHLVSYLIFAGGVGDTGGNLTIRPEICIRPRFDSANAISSVPEPNGVRVYYQANFTASEPGSYTWTFSDGFSTVTYTTNGSANIISRLYGPFTPVPTFNVKYQNACDGSTGNGNPTPPCGAICLSLGAPTTRTGTDGGGANSTTYTPPCGTFSSSGSKWFQMVALTNASGIATVTTEGSTYDTIIGVYRGSISSPGNLTLVACNDNISPTNKQSRVQFETLPGTNYWLVVNSTNVGALRLTYGYDLKIGGLSYNRTNRALDLRSVPLPSYSYELTTTTNVTNNPANWTLLLTTNFTGNATASNNILRYLDTNPPGSSRRFYQIRRP